MSKEMLTGERQQILAAKVREILRSNQLSREEIQGLFRSGMPQSSDPRIAGIAEQIIILLIEEQLSITEAANVLKEVTSGLSLDTDSPLVSESELSM